MSRIIPRGEQSFVTLRQKNLFYVDKTKFIKEWWAGRDSVTLITRPRRFGKTLMLDTVRSFFSLEFAGRGDLFEGLEIWGDENFRAHFLSFFSLLPISKQLPTRTQLKN